MQEWVSFYFLQIYPQLEERLERLQPAMGQTPTCTFPFLFFRLPLAGLSTPAARGHDFLAAQVLDSVHPQAPQETASGGVGSNGSPIKMPQVLLHPHLHHTPLSSNRFCTSCRLLRWLIGSVYAFLFLFFLTKNTQVFPRVLSSAC